MNGSIEENSVCDFTIIHGELRTLAVDAMLVHVPDKYSKTFYCTVSFVLNASAYCRAITQASN